MHHCSCILRFLGISASSLLSSVSRYGQAGTPSLSISTEYDSAAKTFTITSKQATAPTRDQPEKVPVLIPIKIGLLGQDGAELPFTVAEGKFSRHGDDKSAVLLADEETNKFVLSGVESKPVPSLLRDFSAPVKLEVVGQTQEDLTFIMAHDTDAFNRCGLSARGRPFVLNINTHTRS